MDNQDKYEENTQDKETKDTQAGGGKTPLKEARPEEVKERVKESVQKGVAAVAGALKGFSEEAKTENLAGSTRQAIQKAGETTREVAGTVKNEVQETKTHLKSESMGDVGTAGGTSRTKDVPDLRKTELSKTDEELEKE